MNNFNNIIQNLFDEDSIFPGADNNGVIGEAISESRKRARAELVQHIQSAHRDIQRGHSQAVDCVAAYKKNMAAIKERLKQEAKRRDEWAVIATFVGSTAPERLRLEAMSCASLLHHGYLMSLTDMNAMFSEANPFTKENSGISALAQFCKQNMPED